MASLITSLPQAIDVGASPSFTGLTVDTNTLSVDSTNHRVGLLTTAPTHSLTFSSTSTGSTYYNTSDQTTNYERGLISWSTNMFTIQTQQGGSGANRALRIQSSGTISSIDFNTGASSGQLNLKGSSTSNTTAIGYLLSGFSSTATSGSAKALSLTPIYNQASGTATNTDLHINRTETAIGSGAQLFIDLQVGGTSKLMISNTGTITMTDVANLSFGTSTGTKVGTATTQKIGFWNATPIIQPTRAGQLTDNSGGSSGGNTIAAITAPALLADAASLTTTADAIATLAARLNSLEAKLSAAGGGSGITA